MSDQPADRPRDPMPPASQALLRRLNQWAERRIAANPALAEAIRRRKEEEAKR